MLGAIAGDIFGSTYEFLPTNDPALEVEDVAQALKYAAWIAGD